MLRRSRKQKLENEDQITANGDQDNFFSDEIKDEMETMWEIPQIFHFLHLTKESLNIPQLSIYEMERMLLMPRASKQLANIMTCLLSSPITKAKIRKVPPMPYEFWTNILAHKMTSWFKVYHAKHKDTIKVLETIGVEPEFWNVFSDGSLLDGRNFEDLSFKQRVWLLKTVCDTIMHTRKTVQEDIAKQPWEDQFETTLGVDRYGARYIYFPQFISSDLRIYRHCLDNKILSTVRPVRSKQEVDSETNNSIIMKLCRYRKRKSQSHNSLSIRSNKREIKIMNKDLDNCRCNNDSATGSLINEDTNLSSTSICSNNNISLDAINRKRCRSLSKTSEESILSNAKSSGYDTTTSNDNKLPDDDESSQKVFKGFSNTQNDNCSIGIINEMLDDLRSEIDKKRRVDENRSNITSHDNNNESVSQGNFLGSYNNTTDLCIEILTVERDESDKSIDNLSNSSKTDDEKLNEKINAENSKLPENICFKSVSINDNIDNNVLTSISKSDDEKLSETKVSSNNFSANGEKTDLNKGVTINGSLCASFNDSAPLSEEVVKCEHLGERSICLSMYGELNDSIQEKNSRKRTRYAAIYRSKEDREVIKKKVKEETEKNDKINNADDRDSFASDRKTRLRETMEDDLDDYVNNSESGYNLRKSKRLKTDEFKQHFNELLSDLSVSTFQLMVDSVDGLRDLISVFSENSSERNNTNNMEITPLCEIKLVKKLTELLSSLEKVEIILKDTTRKAKSKLQREWSNFKEGVEDQDSSSEGGLSSNWWVLGSQGCPLSAPGDATLQTLSQSALSPFGSHNRQPRHESENESTIKNTEQNRCKSRKNDERRDGSKKSKLETQGRKQTEKKGQKRESKQHEDNETTSNDEDMEQQTRRVLRARGVSSYTEQFYSDDESNQDELEEWTDVEAVYAAPSASIGSSATYSASKIRHVDNWSETEDSDQDWILPSSRKRKNKRPSANRRLKSFQHKLQSIKQNTFQNNTEFHSDTFHSGGAKTGKNKSKDNRERKRSETHTPIDSTCVNNNTCEFANSAAPKQTVPSMDAICKIETVGSMHSELDIKEEGPIYELNQYSENSYSQNPQQNYVMIKTDSNPLNYYVMPQNPTVATGFMPRVSSLMQGGTIVSSIAPPIQQSYYVQSTSNYVIQNSPNFLPIAQQQQSSIFQQQEPQMMTQSYINNTAYVPYVVATTQTEYNVIAPRPLMANPQILQNPVYCAPRSQNKSNQQNRHSTLQPNPLYPNGAVIRSNAPVRSLFCQRSTNPRSIAPKNSVPQCAPNPKAASKQKQTPSTSAENINQKITSLIMLSDSDDEIEMIITEKVTTTTATETSISAKNRSKQALRRTINQVKQKPIVTSDVVVSPTKDIIPPQIIERMNQGGISITPVKSTVPSTMPSTHTQLVVVVNETGSHYALALPNGSKLILTPEQVAQIRASNGGKLIL